VLLYRAIKSNQINFNPTGHSKNLENCLTDRQNILPEFTGLIYIIENNIVKPGSLLNNNNCVIYCDSVHIVRKRKISMSPVLGCRGVTAD